MSEAFLGEIRMFAGNFAPKDWMFCNGAILPISRNTALFAILGTSFGGDGKTNFQLPNFADTVPMGTGAGPGLTPRLVGQSGGTAMVTLTSQEMAAHTHAPATFAGAGQETSPEGAVWSSSSGRDNQFAQGTPDVQMANVMGSAGGGLPHENRAPFLAVSYIICVNGIFPTRP